VPNLTAAANAIGLLPADGLVPTGAPGNINLVMLPADAGHMSDQAFVNLPTDTIDTTDLTLIPPPSPDLGSTTTLDDLINDFSGSPGTAGLEGLDTAVSQNPLDATDLHLVGLGHFDLWF
jgi:hypothetical protein